jgi:hypothetical protein
MMLSLVSWQLSKSQAAYLQNTCMHKRVKELSHVYVYPTESL